MFMVTGDALFLSGTCFGIISHFWSLILPMQSSTYFFLFHSLCSSLIPTSLHNFFVFCFFFLNWINDENFKFEVPRVTCWAKRSLFCIALNLLMAEETRFTSIFKNHFMGEGYLTTSARCSPLLSYEQHLVVSPSKTHDQICERIVP